ncbi:lytic transglycosylase domain-containing protein [Phenylobacterium sp. SCN 70-31]|uniref:lytic transglycosylase domain-containing protein n=1 Tax=Phenylobacterium sp. SCN 70-31 TaxID=1660129 RepID=UPI00086DCFEB|nr:lytic transglycosylase domain-containing protein [Phenylobacterium sp. SCN 70-31]ODT86662.1 MAG: lytic transglycosylase [Phenylobacterium sp. SCN 70-31]
MTLKKRLRVGALSLFAAASFAATAAVAQPRPLSDTDARAYTAAFQAVEQGDFVGAQLQASEIQDRSLDGYLSFRALMHPTAHKASFEELAGWLERFRDLPLADRVFSLAHKRKPGEAAQLPTPEVALVDTARSEVTKPAREAFYSGDAPTAFRLAVNVGERWIAGLAAWRLQDYAQAQDYFAQVARDTDEDPWQRAAGAYWAHRAASMMGDTASAHGFLRLAAQAPHTFYGMIAERQTALLRIAEAPTGQLTLAAYRPPTRPAVEVLGGELRAHRAAALAQIGRHEEARQEIRAGLALARTGEERDAWTALLSDFGLSGVYGGSGRGYLTLGDYQAPPLSPRNGFTMDKALVYAIVRQESAFNPMALSHAGARGLMQLLPTSAALATGDRNFVKRPRTLFDPALNLRAGQDYLAYLMDRGVGPDLLKMVAAYNGGPGAVLSTIQKVGDDDTLLLIECLPALETRNYVEKVMAGYWTYKRMFGEETRTLDALASGARRIDARLDLTPLADPDGAQPQIAPQPLQVGAAAMLQTASFD